MAAAIIAGLVKTSLASAKTQIHVSEPWDVNRAKVAALGVRTTTSNAEAARGADVIVLAVKPQVARPVLEELAAGAWPADRPLPLLVSIAAGVTAGSLQRWATAADGHVPPVVRVMPNTPALLGEGASGLFAGEGVSEDQRALATALVGSVSKVAEWVEREELLDVVTGLSGTCKTAPPLLYRPPSLENALLTHNNNNNNRLRPSLLLRPGRAPRRLGDQARPRRRPGRSAGLADLPRRRAGARPGDRDPDGAPQERHQPERHDRGRHQELRRVRLRGHRRQGRAGRDGEGGGAGADAGGVMSGTKNVQMDGASE